MEKQTAGKLDRAAEGDVPVVDLRDPLLAAKQIRALMIELATCKEAHMANCLAADKLRSLNADLLAMLEECCEFIEEYVDVLDGDDGAPRPNKAMNLHQEVERLIERAKGGA